MSTTLDEQRLFDEHCLEVELESINRSSTERTVPGLDGVLSIDLGQRSRKIKQAGTLHAKSHTEMEQRIEAISAYLDGETHVLVTKDGRKLESLRMDAFRVSKERTGGGSLFCDYEIVYTQLSV